MPATTFAELFGAVFAPAEDLTLGVEQGPTGAEITGTLSGTATLPPSPETAIGRAITYSGLSVPKSGVDVSIQPVETDCGRGVVAECDPQTKTSDDDGLVEFVMFKGWTYKTWRGPLKTLREFVVPSTTEEGLDGNDNFDMDSIIGAD